MSTASTDRIEKRIVLKAPRSRVWRAVSDAGEFGQWFRVELEGPFSAGARVQGRITVPGYEHLRMDMTVERMEPERLFSWRWRPTAIDPAYADDPTTLVEMRLEEAEGGTLLTVVESGFDGLPASRRDEAFRRNADGWAGQMENIARHVAS